MSWPYFELSAGRSSECYSGRYCHKHEDLHTGIGRDGGGGCAGFMEWLLILGCRTRQSVTQTHFQISALTSGDHAVTAKQKLATSVPAKLAFFFITGTGCQVQTTITS